MELLKATQTDYLESAKSRPTLNGSDPKEPFGMLELIVGDEITYIKLDKDGKWDWTAPADMDEGNYIVSIRTRDAAGNYGEPRLLTLIIDTIPPVPPVLLYLDDDQGLNTGLFLPGKTTDDVRPKLSGIAEKGSTVYLKDADGNTIGSAKADNLTGLWEMEPTTDLKQGDNALTLVAEEIFGGKPRLGTPSDVIIITVGPDGGSVLPPGTLTIEHAIDDFGINTGKLSNGALTDDTTPELQGSVSAGSTVVIYYRLTGSSVWAGSSTATVSGESWSWTPGSALAFGKYEFQASGGNFFSALFSLNIASQADIISRTRIDSVVDDFGVATGLLDSGAITDDATPTFNGSAEANSKVVVRYTLVGNLSASVVVDADSAGKWSWTPASALPAGMWSFEVQEQGKSGWSDSFVLNITSSGGFAPVIDYAVDDVGVIENLASGAITDDTTPTLHGRAEANSVVYLRYKLGSGSATTITFTADAVGNWVWTPSTLQTGNWTFEVQKAGQTGWNNFALIVDPTYGQKPTIEYADDNVGSVQDTLYSGATTDDATPTLHGSGPANGQISLRYTRSGSAGTIVTVNVNSAGEWNWTPASLATGDWTFEVQRAGQSDWNKFTLKIDPTVDIEPVITSGLDDVGTPSLLLSGDTTDDNTPTLFGSSAANSVVYLQASKLGQALNYSFVSGSNGKWDWTPPVALSAGYWDFQVRKSPQKSWGTSFKLNIDAASGGNKLLDFEASQLGGLGLITGDGFTFSAQGNIPYISASPAGVSTFGNKSLEFKSLSSGAKYTVTDSSKYLKSFSFDVYPKIGGG